MANGSIPLPEIEDAAIAELGLRRVTTEQLTIARVERDGRVFFVDTAKSKPVNGFHLKRIQALAIPPAWRDVRVARDKQAHLQAVGRDDEGRLQYIYHSAWDDVRAISKAYRLLELGQALPRLRRAIIEDIRPPLPSFPLAAAARLVDIAHLRAGHEAYAGDEGGRGVATLLKKHVHIDKHTICLSFRGKGGKKIEKQLEDEPLAEALTVLCGLRGARLFKLEVTSGLRPMTASDLNAYLVERSRRSISAKDFRTFFASARALERLEGLEVPKSNAARRRILADVAREVSGELANTPAITRKSYIHPAIVETFEMGGLVKPPVRRVRHGLSPAESSLVRFLERHILADKGA